MLGRLALPSLVGRSKVRVWERHALGSWKDKLQEGGLSLPPGSQGGFPEDIFPVLREWEDWGCGGVPCERG